MYTVDIGGCELALSTQSIRYGQHQLTSHLISAKAFQLAQNDRLAALKEARCPPTSPGEA
jgi:hypothetical protein